MVKRENSTLFVYLSLLLSYNLFLIIVHNLEQFLKQFRICIVTTSVAYEFKRLTGLLLFIILFWTIDLILSIESVVKHSIYLSIDIFGPLGIMTI